MKNYWLFLIIIILFIPKGRLFGQDNSIRPQLWNNLYLSWNINDDFAFRNAIAYNVLLSSGYPWNEFSYSGAAAFTFKPWLEGIGGLYLASTRQSENLRSTEIRPSVGLRFMTSISKRWMVSNQSRMELRNIFYSKGSNNTSWRLRNRTFAAVSLNRRKLDMDNNLSVIGYFEAFYNLDDEVVERFFTSFKYKLGLRYRLNYTWRFDLGAIYQDAKDNVREVGNIPVNTITNYIIDWGIAYIIPPKKKK